MKRELEVFDIKSVPMPTSGREVIAFVTVPYPHGLDMSYTTIVWTDGLGPMDRQGDYYQNADFITHWAELPEKILTSINHN